MPFVQKPYRAFGFVILKNTHKGDSSFSEDYPQNRKWYNYFTAGKMINNSFANGHTLPDYSAGDWIGPEDMGGNAYGVSTQTPVDDPVCWCINADMNNGYLPDCEKWFLAAGQSVTMPQGTKIFLCSGTLVVNSKTLTTETQVHVKSTERLFEATTDCYGIKFV